MTEREREPADGWYVPSDYGGHAAAIQSMASVAAPLLAGFGFTLMTLIVQSPGSFRFPDGTLLVLALATFGFLFSVQFGLHARQYFTTPAEVRAWWGDDPAARFRQEQRADLAKLQRWTARARHAFDVSIIGLLVALALVLVPVREAPVIRWLAVGVAVVVILVELVWFGWNRRSGKLAGASEEGGDEDG
jgi:hypothetical protein